MSKYITYLFLIGFTSICWGQIGEQQKLEERKAQIQAQIKENEKLLQNVKTQEKSVLNVIGIKDQKIRLKENLINTTENQTKLLGNDIYKNQIKINELNRELDKLKADYAEMILKSYKSRSEQSRAMFLLSSKNFLQAYKRLQYMKQYSSYRKMQGDEIIAKASELDAYNQKLSNQKEEKHKLIKENETEKLTLEQEKQEQEKLINSIKKDKKKLRARLKTATRNQSY